MRTVVASSAGRRFVKSVCNDTVGAVAHAGPIVPSIFGAAGKSGTVTDRRPVAKAVVLPKRTLARNASAKR
jgi:hypothetical protein